MNEFDKKLKNMEKFEELARIDVWIKKYLELEKLKEEKIKDLISNTTYIEWLKKFSQNRNCFSNCDYKKMLKKNSEIDHENVENLMLFYDGIQKYAKSNYIYPISYDSCDYYKINYNGFCFEIGKPYNQDEIVIFKKEVSFNDEYIDFNDIMTNKKRDNIDYIKNTLKTLKEIVTTSCQNNVPIKALIETFNEAIGDYDTKEKALIKNKNKR